MSGANILPPCVNKSEHETTLFGIDVYMGFMHLQSLETRTAQLIVQERNHNGDYRSLEDFIKRIPVGIATIQILIFIGAFRFTGFPKNELLLKARMLLNDFKPEQRFQVLFEEPVKEYELPVLKR